jgi:phospholipid/cholesterol/gamma-HCH transport system substrate-binding protein
VATEAHKLQVGAFVMGAAIIGISGAIWLGASRYFEDTGLLITYFSESVQGLEPGASVKYRGVPAGRVEDIAIAPDGDLIEVLMSIDVEFAESVREDETLRAQLQLSGITGLRYVEINRHSGEALENSPELSFEPPYPLIPSTPSSFKAIQEALEDIYDKVMSVDVEGISSDARATLQAADQVLRDDRLQRTMTNLAEVSESAGRLTVNLEQITSDVELKQVVADLSEAAAEARALFTDLRAGATGKQLRATLGEVDEVANATGDFIVRLQITLERLDRTASNLEQLTTDLRQQPSRLLFSEPPPAKRPVDEERR